MNCLKEISSITRDTKIDYLATLFNEDSGDSISRCATDEMNSVISMAIEIRVSGDNTFWSDEMVEDLMEFRYIVREFSLLNRASGIFGRIETILSSLETLRVKGFFKKLFDGVK